MTTSTIEVVETEINVLQFYYTFKSLAQRNIEFENAINQVS